MELPIYWTIPFVLILLSTAIIPLINTRFWEDNLWWIALGMFTLPMSVALLFFLGPHLRNLTFEKSMEYVSLILVLGALYTISGGIQISGDFHGNPLYNVLFLFAGSIAASLIGTLAASMLLIGPLIHANSRRKRRAHVVVFFIFLVSNIGGILSPIGDPALFLGHLEGVPFQWTLRLLPYWTVTTVTILVIFFIYDSYLLRKEAKHQMEGSSEKLAADIDSVRYRINAALAGFHLDEMIEHKQIRLGSVRQLQKTLSFASAELERIVNEGLVGARRPIHFGGKANFLLLGCLVVGVYMQEKLSVKFPWWPHFGPREIAAVVMAVISLIITPPSGPLRKENGFSFFPLKQVALLYTAIFTTMIPVLYILNRQFASPEIVQPYQLFWATGILSSFIDSVPSYLTMLSAGSSLNMPNNPGFVFQGGISVTKEILMAVSLGAVFMGANTYAGNSTNLMVRWIAESRGVRMPSFPGYMVYSILVLLPTFLLISYIFLL